jgi:hypothetical protein
MADRVSRSETVAISRTSYAILWKVVEKEKAPGHLQHSAFATYVPILMPGTFLLQLCSRPEMPEGLAVFA